MSEREHDILLVGATGFTGALVAEYLARAAPDSCRWALGGRDRAKLESVRARVAAVDARWADLPLVAVDVTDAASARAAAESTRVIATTVGPFLRHGEALVAACARAGTGYVDLTGEPEFVDLMYVRYHAEAVASGARIVHACGFDSIPYDLGVLHAVSELASTSAAVSELASTSAAVSELAPSGPVDVVGVVRARGAVSGGTFASAVESFGRPRQMAAAAKARHRAEAAAASEAGSDGRRVRIPLGAPTRRDGLWLVPLPTLDPQIVGRSARALPQYGPDFTYRHYAGVRHLPVVAGAALALGGLAALAQLPPTRSWLLGRMSSGQGPSQEQRAAGWFTARFTATSGGRTVVTEVSGGEPGYAATSVMFGEAALCLALDDLPLAGGQLTTAVAMGQPLITRLHRAGIEIRTLAI